MRLEIKDIINKHIGAKCIIVGHGVSLNDYANKLKQFKDNGYIIIGCNNWYEFYNDCPPHYWLSANNQDHCMNLLPIINKNDSIWVYADSVDLTDKGWVDANFKNDYLAYDQRHFGGASCPSCMVFGCKKYRDEKRLTIQEELQKYTGFDKHYSTGHTVAVHMIAFSILMGFSEIYIIGLDFDYHKGYAKNSTNRSALAHINHFDLKNYGGETIKDVEIIAESAKNIGTKIYNVNKNSWWQIFEYKDIPLIEKPKTNRIVSIILARGGSKGIPNKNIIEIAGKPLLAWTVEQSVKSKFVTETYVSSDSPEILDIAVKYGAKTIVRPPELATDNSTSEEALIHALKVIGDVDAVVFLQPTSPIREYSDIDNAINTFKEKELDSLFSASIIDDYCIWSETNGVLNSINFDYRNRTRRQDKMPQYLENGSIYVFKPEILINSNNRLGGKIGIHIMDFWKSYEIDSIENIEICEYYLKTKILKYL